MSNLSSNEGDLLAVSDLTPALPSRFEILIPLLEEIPVQHAQTETGRAPRLLARTAILFAVAVLAYLPCFWAGLLDGERDRLRYLTAPEPAWHTAHQLTAWFELRNRVPNLLRILIYLQHGPEGATPLCAMVSVTLHASATILLWLVLRRLSQHAAFLAALLFAVHPANVPAVMLASQQGRLWAAVFSLIGILLLLKNRSVPAELPPDHPEYFIAPARWFLTINSIISLTGALLAFLLAALCQPAAVVIPLLAIVLIAWKKKLTQIDWILLLPMFALCCVLATIVAHDSYPHLAIQSAQVHSKFTSMFLWPAGRVVSGFLLLHSPVVPWIDASSLSINLVTALAMTLVLCLVPTLAFFKQTGVIPGLILLSFLLLVPTVWAPVAVHVSGPNQQEITNPGEAYFCQIPFIVLFANGILKLTQLLTEELTKAKSQLVLAAAIATALAITTARYANDFSSTERLLNAAVAAESHSTNRRSTAARGRLAAFYLKKATPQGVTQAGDELKEVNLENCQNASTAIVKGDYLAATGQTDAALQWYQHAQDLQDSSPNAVDHLAALYMQLNRPADAIMCYQNAIQKHPEVAALKTAYGRLLNQTGQLDQAIEQFINVTTTDPDEVTAHVYLADAYFIQGKLNQGAAELQIAHALDPDNFEAYHSAGFVLAQLHHYDEAIRELTIATQLEPDSAEARNDLAAVLVATGKFNRAIFEFQQILAEHPDDEPAKHNLDIAKKRLAEQKSQQSTNSPATDPATTNPSTTNPAATQPAAPS